MISKKIEDNDYINNCNYWGKRMEKIAFLYIFLRLTQKHF